MKLCLTKAGLLFSPPSSALEDDTDFLDLAKFVLSEEEDGGEQGGEEGNDKGSEKGSKKGNQKGSEEGSEDSEEDVPLAHKKVARV